MIALAPATAAPIVARLLRPGTSFHRASPVEGRPDILRADCGAFEEPASRLYIDRSATARAGCVRCSPRPVLRLVRSGSLYRVTYAGTEFDGTRAVIVTATSAGAARRQVERDHAGAMVRKVEGFK